MSPLAWYVKYINAQIFAAMFAATVYGQYTPPGGGSGGGVWGGITGTLSSQSDLQTALNAKAATANNLSDLASATTGRVNLGLNVNGALRVATAGAASQAACADLSNAAASCSTDTTNAANIASGILPAGRLPNPTASALGGIQSAASVSHQWIDSVSTSGVPHQSQPACSDITNCSTISLAPPYLVFGGTKYIGATGYAATLPGTSPSWINSVAPTTVTAGTNGDLIAISGGSDCWELQTLTTSVEVVAAAAGNTGSSSNNVGVGVWLWDSSNNNLYELDVLMFGNAGLQIKIQKFSWNGGASNPSFSTNSTMYSMPFSVPIHIKESISGSTITYAMSLNGGANYETIGTQAGVGTVTKGGYKVPSTSMVDIYSLSVN